jgi:hypothetical protein
MKRTADNMSPATPSVKFIGLVKLTTSVADDISFPFNILV